MQCNVDNSLPNHYMQLDARHKVVDNGSAFCDSGIVRSRDREANVAVLKRVQ